MTSCKKCVFKQVTNNIQTGCEFGRIETFKKVANVAIVNGFYQFDRFCNRWSAKPIAIDLVRQYSALPYTAVLLCEPTEQLIGQTLELDPPPKELIIVSNDRKKLKPQYRGILLIEELTGNKLLFHIAAQVKTPYYYPIYELDPEFISRAEYIYNEELRPFWIYRRNNQALYMRRLRSFDKEVIPEEFHRLIIDE